jgi:ribosomal-protein-serine acetyltransferase
MWDDLGHRVDGRIWQPPECPAVLTRVLHDGISLRLPEERDTDELYALIDANREYLARWMPWAAEQTRPATLEFIRACRRQVGENNGLQTAILIDGAIAGMIGVHGIDWQHRSTSIGFWLAEEAQGRGAVTAAFRAYIDHAFEVWGLERMEQQAGVDNRRSRAVAERLGFTHEGVLRHAFRVGDRWVDHAVYAMLAEDWRGR